MYFIHVKKQKSYNEIDSVKDFTWAFPNILGGKSTPFLEGLEIFSTLLLSCSCTTPVSSLTADCVGVVAVIIIPWKNITQVNSR